MAFNSEAVTEHCGLEWKQPRVFSRWSGASCGGNNGECERPESKLISNFIEFSASALSFWILICTRSLLIEMPFYL